ncbi:MAG: leucine-rich repeat domain-containing protein [Coriobacteriales bacterium]|jgi:Leucine-rich repeat (LRR) protein|nr:leucine-rich repeat domain-containing protein [Coriobacteriales bacterium]
MRILVAKLFGTAIVASIGSFVLFATPAYAADTAIAVDATNFPDSSFRSYVAANYDTDSSGLLDDSSLTETVIDASALGIADLTGIEHFPQLQVLDCSNNNLSVLDLSHNPALERLHCSRNQLTALDLSHSPALWWLNCGINKLSVLDLSHTPALRQLGCYENQLSALDLSHTPDLVELYCNENQLTALDLGLTPALESLGCYGNQLTALDLTHNPGLTFLDAYKNQLYDILGVSATPGFSHWSSAEQSLTIPVIPDPDNPGSYLSLSSYLLDAGHSIALPAGVEHDLATGFFSTTALDTPFAFTTTTAAGLVEGTIVFTSSMPPTPPAPPAPPASAVTPPALPSTGDAALLLLALATLCALLGALAVAAARWGNTKSQRPGSPDR